MKDEIILGGCVAIILVVIGLVVLQMITPDFTVNQTHCQQLEGRYSLKIEADGTIDYEWCKTDEQKITYTNN